MQLIKYLKSKVPASSNWILAEHTEQVAQPAANKVIGEWYHCMWILDTGYQPPAITFLHKASVMESMIFSE